MLKGWIHFLLVPVFLLAAGTAWGRPHKVRVEDPALAKSLIAQGGRLIADYGGFQLIEVEEPQFVKTSRAAVELADESDFIQLNARPLDTRAPEVRGLRRPVAAFAGRRLHLVQFAGPVKPDWIAALERNGAQIVSYVPHNAYLVYGDAPALTQLQSWAGATDYVQWEGDYADDYKIHPRARTVDDKGLPQTPVTDTFAVQLVDDADANAATLGLVDQLKLEPVKRQFRTLHYLNLIVRLPPERLKEIAVRPEVVSIQPYVERKKLDERQDQIVAGNLAGGLPGGPGYLAWLAGKGFSQAQFTASGFVVDVSDSGIDNGTKFPGHFGLYPAGNPAQFSRVIYNRLEGTPNPGSTLQGCDGHGNLNTHIIAGYSGFTNGFPHADAGGFAYGLGVCPFVKVGSSVIFDPNNFTSPNYTTLESDAYQSGARVSANSWGGDVAGAYDVDAQTYDALVRNAGGSTSNRQIVIVFAAGNAGPGAQTMDSPGSAKNVIAVGAAENVRSLTPANGGNDASGNDGCSTADSGADNAEDLIDFSSRGPCSDGRMKPDIVAPGTHITGGVGQSRTNVTGNGSAISCFSGTGVCGLPGGGTAGSADNFFPLNQQFYTVSSGTSHSTPAVAGACALLRQYFINKNFAPPSPAMTKAYLINSARYLTGIGANDTLWSANQGMGELNLGTAFDGVPRVLRDQVPADKFTATGQTRTFTGTVSNPAQPFRVTLAWTDAPGSTAGNAFNNDLDLTVTVGGITYKGNVFSGALSTTGGSADSKNNVESVFLPAGVTGSFLVAVTAANINSDGVPNEAPSLDQDFALVVYNGAQSSVPVISSDSFALAAEGCYPTNGVIDPGETVVANFALRNLGNVNTTNLVATLLETNGVMAPGGSRSYGGLVAGGGAVTQSFTFTAAGNCGGVIVPTLQLQDGATTLGVATFTFQLGMLTTIFQQNFDSVTAPALPAGWTSSAAGGQSPWVTQSSVSDSAPNSAFSPDPATIGSNNLVSPSIALPAGQTQLSFQNSYDLEASSGDSITGYDGGVLEIRIGAGAWTDILAAGGSFASGGYNRTLSSSFGNPFAGRQAWSGNSGGLITTIVNLPAAAAGQTIQLRWRCGSDDSVSRTGWHIDTVAITGRTCCTGSTADLSISQSVSPAFPGVGSNLIYTLTVTNQGPNPAGGTTVTDALPSGVSFVSAVSSQGNCTNSAGTVVCGLGTLNNGATATITITAAAMTAGPATNASSVFTISTDPINTNNTAGTVVLINSPPMISNIADVTTNENTVAGPIGFTIGDAETPAAALTLSASSSNTNLVPPANLVFGGSGSNRNLTLMPATNQSGTATITVTVSDGLASASAAFVFTVQPVNQAPVLAPIPDFILGQGQALMFTNVAMDSDVPPQTLAFSLSNAPAGATLDPSSGVFLWSPAPAQNPSTNSITVTVTDDGVPPLSDAKTFRVTVGPWPVIEAISLSNDVVVLTWSAAAGQSYRLQLLTDPGSTNWVDVPGDVLAGGATASKSDTVGAFQQKFYRVRLVP